MGRERDAIVGRCELGARVARRVEGGVERGLGERDPADVRGVDELEPGLSGRRARSGEPQLRREIGPEARIGRARREGRELGAAQRSTERYLMWLARRGSRGRRERRVVDVEDYVCAHVRGVTFGLERGGDVASWPERRN